jgi:hypothetical protein
MLILPKLAAGLAAAATLLSVAPAAGAHPRDPVPVPAGNTPFLEGHARGVQIYACTAGAWTFVAPRADLFDGHGRLIVKHFAGPTWQANDGSRVVGKAEATATVDPTAIPWLRLAAVSTTPGRLGHTSFIQRINTRGGLAPAGVCAELGAQAEVPYTADYVFWRHHRGD